jgi:hypothetical protein
MMFYFYIPEGICFAAVLCHRYIFFYIQVLAGALALGFDSAIATSLNMLPRASIDILEAMRNNRPKEALQEQRKLSQAINAITCNGMCLILIDTGHVKSKYILIDAISMQKHHNKTITQWI